MAHDHSHDSGSRRRLAIVFGIVLVIFVFQVIGSITTGSLALIDTGHNSVDLIGIGIALFAATLVRKPPKGQKTWGFAGPRCLPPERRRLCRWDSASTAS